MTQTTNPLDLEIADIDAKIAELTTHRNVLAGIRVQRYGPFADGKTYPIAEVTRINTPSGDLNVRHTTSSVKKVGGKRPTSFAKLALTCLRKVGEKGAKRDAIRTYATMVRGEVKPESFSSVLQNLKKDGKIVLVDHRYYIKGKAPAQAES